MRYLLILVIALTSCSPQARLSGLLKRHPELIKRDTVFHHDTIRVASVSKDTIFSNLITRDTIIIKQDRLTIKYFNSRDSVFISGKCDSIVKLVSVPVIVNSADAKGLTGWQKFWSDFKDYLIALLLGAILILLVLQRVKIKT